jgi:outer membrane protein TolC
VERPASQRPVVPNWIRTFGDPELTALVADAVERNPTSRLLLREWKRHAPPCALPRRRSIPGSRRRDWASGKVARLAAIRGLSIDPPDLGGLGVDSSGGSADTNTTDSSSQRWVYGIGIGASWELDVWGRIRSRKAAAKAEKRALEADYEFAGSPRCCRGARVFLHH